MIRLIFKGNVQGVGFRATTRLLGQRLGLDLEAHNLPNGDVEILLTSATPTQIESLTHSLKSQFAITSIQQFTK